jgi:hypothetical protein
VVTTDLGSDAGTDRWVSTSGSDEGDGHAAAAGATAGTLGGTSDSVAEATALVTLTDRKLGIDVVAGEPDPATTPIDIAPSAVTDASTARGTPLQRRCLCRGWAWWGVRCRTV